MSYVENLGEKLARDVLAAQQELNNPNLVQEIAKVLEASSSTLHEAFMTAVRVYDANDRAHGVLQMHLKAAAKARSANE
jgi:hypothetical protein